VVFKFARERPAVFKKLVLGAWDAGIDTAELEFNNNAWSTKKRAGGIASISTAETSFEQQTAAGFTQFTITAGMEAEFTVKSFDIALRNVALATLPSDSTAVSMLQVGGPMAASTVLGMDLLSFGLAVGGGCLFLLCLVAVLIIALRRSRALKSDKHSNAVITTSVESTELQPAMADALSARSDLPPPVFGTLSSGGYGGTGSEFNRDTYQNVALSPPVAVLGAAYVAPRTANAYQAAGNEELLRAICNAPPATSGALPPPTSPFLSAQPSSPGYIDIPRSTTPPVLSPRRDISARSTYEPLPFANGNGPLFVVQSYAASPNGSSHFSDRSTYSELKVTSSKH